MFDWNAWFDWEGGLYGLKIVLGVVAFFGVVAAFVTGGIYGYLYLEETIGIVGASTALAFYSIPGVYVIFSFIAKVAE